jgi:Flp pilus assembly pilin Flp
MIAMKKILCGGACSLVKKITALLADQRGASALEFALFAGILCFGLLNTADISIYIYKRMQVENATEMAVQAAWKACDPSKGQLPATTSCPGLNAAITGAVQSTSLGNQVSFQAGSPSEAYTASTVPGRFKTSGGRQHSTDRLFGDRFTSQQPAITSKSQRHFRMRRCFRASQWPALSPRQS